MKPYFNLQLRWRHMDAVDALGTPISHSSTAPTALYVVTAPTALSAVTATTALSTTLTFTLLTSSNPKLNHISLLFLTSLPHPSKRIPILSLFIITNNPFLLMLDNWLGFRLSRSKSEYMECKFNKRRRVSNLEVKIGDHIIPQVTQFKYLGSVIQDDGEIEGDVNHRIQAGWMKWRKALGVLCDAKVPIKLKGKFYRTAVRPAILYGTECWAVKSQHENKVCVAEMRMLRWMCGKTRQDKIRNEAIRERVGVAPIVEKMVENRLRISLELEHIVLDGEEEEDEPVFVLTDEWREFFAQSEARRKLEKKQGKKGKK
ncbi:hypothetical protein HKD37_16G045160 [Glycine soja]